MSHPHRICAGALVIHKDRVLLVKQHVPNHDDFWGPPGGGVEGDETLFDCAVRECFEEGGLRVRPLKFVYIEEFFDAGRRVCKHWIHCEPIDHDLSLNITNAYADEGLIDASSFPERISPRSMYSHASCATNSGRTSPKIFRRSATSAFSADQQIIAVA